MAEVFEFKSKKIFTLEEAGKLLPLVKKITQEAVEQMALLEQRASQEDELNKIVQRWSDKITKLGAIPKGFWLVDFDNGSGYFCWKYSEDTVTHFHDYATGFSGRTPIV